jgi:hypothetical protein
MLAGFAAMEKLAAGEYQLPVKIRDSVTGQSIKQDATLKIIEKSCSNLAFQTVRENRTGLYEEPILY